MLHLSEIPDDIFLLNIAINSIKYYYIYFRFNRGKNNIIFLKFEKERIVSVHAQEFKGRKSLFTNITIIRIERNKGEIDKDKVIRIIYTSAI